MPIDMTMPLYLSHEDFFFRSTSETSSQNSCLRFRRAERANRAELGDTGTSKAKKHVTFADHRGLSLTRVKVFSEFSDPIDIPLRVLTPSAPTAPAQDNKLALDFTQPAQDYLQFRQNLEQNLVSLEQCVLKEAAFAGTVKVKNVSFEKSVTLRVTFDSWRSHADVRCEYVKDSYPGSSCDTFAFEVALPADLPPQERVEFAVCYEAAGQQHWDSNQGRNYGIVRSHMKRGPDPFGIHFDRYGSPTCSHGLFPDWPSYAGYENIGPYY